MPLSFYGRKAMLDWLWGGAAPTNPTARYLGLATGAPDAGGGSEIGANSGYARQTLVMAAANAAAGSVSNAQAATFGPFSSIAPIVGYQIWDDPTAGNMWFQNTFVGASTVSPGDKIGVAAAAIVVTMPIDGLMTAAAKLMLDWMCGGAAATRPAGRTISFATGLPTEGGASEGRATPIRGTLTMAAAISGVGSGTVTNLNAISATVSGGVAATFVGWNLYDGAAGQRLAYGTVSAAIGCKSTDSVSFPAAGSLRISLV